ncbi:MAG: hypothetical protein HC930_12440 [Hydrococcus sp. SU_1_0]|nr:hypothetical protein [Hydrococcus sp. SU_1_0]
MVSIPNPIDLARKALEAAEEAAREAARKAEEVARETARIAEEAARKAEEVAREAADAVNISKGVDYFVYLSGQNFQVKVSSPKKRRGQFSFQPKNSLVGKMQKGHREIAMFDIGAIEHSGRFEIAASKNGNSPLIEKYAEIAPSDGNLHGSDMGNMLQTPSIVTQDYSVSYGFYDAGVIESHQAYIYVTDNYSNWMAQLFREMPALKKGSLELFVLPGSHDAGMFTGIVSDELVGALIKFIPGLNGLALSTAKRALINLAYTQKDNIKTQLELGIRYFDFRPGYNLINIDGILRHQHSFVPGYEFDKFLSDVVSFLKTHQQEIVVVNIKYSGFARDDMKPSDQEVKSSIDTALSGSGITKGNIDDLNKQ